MTLPSGALSSAEWLARFAAEIGVDAPGESEIAPLLRLAGIAAHSSDRTAAPIACWLIGCVGIAPERAVEIAEAVLAEPADDRSAGDIGPEHELRAGGPTDGGQV